jgi:hypothetical protein
MPRKKADSTLPQELNENWGSNFMMDGFWHDMDYGHGLRDSIGKDPVPQPSTSGFAHLPDGVIVSNEGLAELEVPEGVVREEDGGMDLEGLEIVANVNPDLDRSNTGVVDHSWLADAFQDPERLPNAPSYNSVLNLQEAWGDRTDGIHRVELYDREVTDYEAVTQRKKDDDPFQADKISHIVRSAMRRSAMGHPIAVILDDARAQAAGARSRIARSLRAVELEHGLVGNVYVRASAYPGLHRGRWSRDLAKAAKRARYLIAQSGLDCTSCAEALGLRLITDPAQIDWNAAYAHYAPGLSASGRLDRNATIDDKRETLRRAFLVAEKSPTMYIEPGRVRHSTPSDRVTLEAARQALTGPAVPRAIVSGTSKARRAESLRLVRKLGALVKGRLITLGEAEELARSRAPAMARIRMAETLAARTARSQYSGGVVRDSRVAISGADFAADTGKALKHETRAKVASVSEDRERTKMLARFSEIAEVYRGAETKVRKIAAAVKAGRRGADITRLAGNLLNENERRLVASILDPILVEAGCFARESAQTYQGPTIRQAVAGSPVTVVSPVEARAAVRWAARQLNEGAVGNDLDQLLAHRFSPPVLKAASATLVQIRQKHEGLAGHLYVDASVYASPAGTEGCDAGALRHRTNGIRYLLAMDRCKTCVFKNADETCQKYRKQIVASVPVEDAEAYRRNVLTSHARSDAEETAALFTDSSTAMSNVVAEFGLHNASLDEVEISDTTAPPALSDIHFGGIEL